jgi:hypothetical protein|tara:strand:+ start:40 stop:648 length:609 start_codon:yes stop_codon:yes gene_type:complete
MMKVIMIALLALGLTNCSQSNYKVNKEVNKEGRVLDKVPQWYVDATINEGIILNRDANTFIYSVGQGTSPDLQLALEKAMMIAKAELADKLQGQMNKRTDLYITEVGQDNSKQVVSKIEETVVNIVRETMIQGYEQWEKAVYETANNHYRVYVGLKMGIGDANRLADYIAKHATSTIDVDTLAKNAIEKVIITNPDGIPTVE